MSPDPGELAEAQSQLLCATSLHGYSLSTTSVPEGFFSHTALNVGSQEKPKSSCLDGWLTVLG